MIRVGDLLKSPSLSNSYLIAGHDGINNVIQKLEIMEEPYPGILKYLSPGELLLTNFWSLKDDLQSRCELLRYMIDNKCAALGIMPGPHLNARIEPEMIDIANRNGFPIIYINDNARWGDIITEYGVLTHSDIFSHQQVGIGELLEAILQVKQDKKVDVFCEKLSEIIDLPLVMTTNAVYSSHVRNPSLIAVKIQELLQQSQDAPSSPVLACVEENVIAIICFGKHSTFTACIPDVKNGKDSIQFFYRIASLVVKTLDQLGIYTPVFRRKKSISVLEHSSYCYCLFRTEKTDVAQNMIGRELQLYERNDYYDYYIYLIPVTNNRDNNIFSIYQNIRQELNPSVFVFSLSPKSRKGIEERLDMLASMFKTCAYLEGVYACDELSLIYALGKLSRVERRHIQEQQLQKLSLRADERSFVDTLRLYIVLRNMNNVAALLGLHSNSVKYRIGRAVQILGYEEDMVSDILNLSTLMQLELITVG